MEDARSDVTDVRLPFAYLFYGIIFFASYFDLLFFLQSSPYVHFPVCLNNPSLPRLIYQLSQYSKSWDLKSRKRVGTKEAYNGRLCRSQRLWLWCEVLRIAVWKKVIAQIYVINHLCMLTSRKFCSHLNLSSE